MTQIDTLDDIRAKIDAIDIAIHDLIMQRTEIVSEIIEAKKYAADNTQDSDQIPALSAYRPAREAQILSHLLHRHKGALPHSSIIELWRHLFSTFCNMQCEFSVAYFGGSEAELLRDTVRYYFSAAAKLRKSATELSVLHAVSSGDVTLGILPIASIDGIDEWWLNLPTGLYVSGAFPFVTNDPIVNVRNDYMIISYAKPVKTDDDKSLFKISGSPDVGRISVIGCFNGLSCDARSICIHDSPDLSTRFHLVEVDGFFSEQKLDDFISDLIGMSGGKILDVSYLGSYPATVSMNDFKQAS